MSRRIAATTPRLVLEADGEIRCEACQLPRLLEQPAGVPCIPCLEWESAGEAS